MSKKKTLYHLTKNRLPKNMRWMQDIDYIEQLTDDEKEWLNKFLKEYYDGNVPKDGDENLHHSTKLRRDCYSRKNRQNRDMMSILNAGGKMDRIQGEWGDDDYEDD